MGPVFCSIWPVIKLLIDLAAEVAFNFNKWKLCGRTLHLIKRFDYVWAVELLRTNESVTLLYIRHQLYGVRNSTIEGTLYLLIYVSVVAHYN